MSLDRGDDTFEKIVEGCFSDSELSHLMQSRPFYTEPTEVTTEILLEGFQNLLSDPIAASDSILLQRAIDLLFSSGAVDIKMGDSLLIKEAQVIISPESPFFVPSGFKVFGNFLGFVADDLLHIDNADVEPRIEVQNTQGLYMALSQVTIESDYGFEMALEQALLSLSGGRPELQYVYYQD